MSRKACLGYSRVEKLKICQLGYKLGTGCKTTQKYSALGILHILVLQKKYYKVYFLPDMNISISRVGQKAYKDTVPGSFSFFALPRSACFCFLISSLHPHCGWLERRRERWRHVPFLEWHNPTLGHITCTLL